MSLTVDSVFDAASIQKQFVAAAILPFEKKRVSLTDDVRGCVPELPECEIVAGADPLELLPGLTVKVAGSST